MVSGSQYQQTKHWTWIILAISIKLKNKHKCWHLSFETVHILSHRQTVLFYFTFLLVFSTLYTFFHMHTSHHFKLRHPEENNVLSHMKLRISTHWKSGNFVTVPWIFGHTPNIYLKSTNNNNHHNHNNNNNVQYTFQTGQILIIHFTFNFSYSHKLAYPMLESFHGI